MPAPPLVQVLVAATSFFNFSPAVMMTATVDPSSNAAEPSQCPSQVHPSVGVMRKPVPPNEVAQCSLILVTERVALTADHCFRDRNLAAPPPPLLVVDDAVGEKITAVFEWDDNRFDFKTTRNVTRYVLFGVSDVAVVLLDKPIVAVSPPTLRSSPLQRGEVVIAQGYTLGFTPTGRTVTNTVLCSNWVPPGAQKGRLPNGHSGGPVLDSTGALVALNSGGGHLKQGDVTLPDYYMFPEALLPLRDEVEKVFEGWEKDVGPLTRPTWAP